MNPGLALNNDPPIKNLSVNERKILKVFFIGYLHKLLSDLFKRELAIVQNDFSLECYAMDRKLIQTLILGILETGNYSLEGIAYYTGIPLDVIYDAAAGLNIQLSITPWVKIVDLYIQVKPDVNNAIIDKLLSLREDNPTAFSVLLSD